MYKLAFFVPPSHVDVVKTAVFAAGGGRIGDYDCCAWQVLGQGQFRPLDGSQPFIGQSGVVEQVEEWRVELVVADELIKSVVAALKLSHPYETPAYEVWQLADF
ncbi:YqfO family protein [Pseudomonas alkylphenolica]|uniref:YqfO family protein n=1 Tax=Pseudomonas alkylphenolica TaxID=237609 RepID=UPI00315CBA00